MSKPVDLTLILYYSYHINNATEKTKMKVWGFYIDNGEFCGLYRSKSVSIEHCEFHGYDVSRLIQKWMKSDEK